MSNCILCRKETNAWSGVKTSEGYMCKDCASHIPTVLRNYLDKMDHTELKLTIRRSDQMKFQKFEATASYGNLHIDSVHGLFAISEKINKDGTLPNTADVFYCLDILDFNIYCVDPKANASNNVTCKVEMAFILHEFKLPIKCIIKKNVKCAHKIINKTQLEWSEPGDLSMFRSMFTQMMMTESKRYHEEQRQLFISPKNIRFIYAKCMYMLPNDYTKEDVMKQWKRLIKVFHPDENMKDDKNMELYARTVNDYRDILLEHIKTEEMD